MKFIINCWVESWSLTKSIIQIKPIIQINGLKIISGKLKNKDEP